MMSMKLLDMTKSEMKCNHFEKLVLIIKKNLLDFSNLEVVLLERCISSEFLMHRSRTE